MPNWFDRPPEPMGVYLADEPFDSSDLIYEACWDGLRTMLTVHRGQARLLDRQCRDVSARFPEIADVPASVAASDTVIDGMIIVLTGGRPNAEALNQRLAGPRSVADGRKYEPAVFVAFDLLMLAGRPLLDVKLSRRKELLKGILRQTPNLVLGTWVRGSGQAFLRQVGKVGIRGIVAKDLESTYESGIRSRSWLRMQRIKEQDCVICGFTEGMGRRAGLLGSLVLGVWRDGELVHAGQVGSGFDHQTVIDLHQRLAPLATEALPFQGAPKTDRAVTWVSPQLVCEVQYQEWTPDRKLRSPRFVRLRNKPADCCEVEEVPVAAGESEAAAALSA